MVSLLDRRAGRRGEQGGVGPEGNETTIPARGAGAAATVGWI